MESEAADDSYGQQLQPRAAPSLLRLLPALGLAVAAVASFSPSIGRGNPEMEAVRQAAKAASHGGRMDDAELSVQPGTAAHHLRTRGEWIKRSYGEHSDAHHPQQYEDEARWRVPGTAHSRRRAQTSTNKLTLANTAPLKIETDFSGLYNTQTAGVRSVARTYTGCFAQGDWFKWNYPSTASPPCASSSCAACLAAGSGSCAAECVFPGSAAPCDSSWTAGSAADSRTYVPNTNPDGIVCNRQHDPSAQDCWGVCLEEDVITAAKRTFIMTEVTAVITEVEALFRVRQRTGNMILAKSKGVYSRLYETMGVNTDAECAKDARVMYRMPVADSYCSVGVDADVVFMPFMTQHVPNVAGFGGDAGKDQYGRPVMITMGWGLGSWGTASGQQNLRDTARAVIMHELVHGLGFNIFAFQNTFDTNGRSKTIVLQAPMQDTDGSTDMVWHAVGERVVAVARAYFQCSAADWNGFSVPLMGENALGDTSRGSHWETRIMKDEFLAYGGGDVVSAFTLAMMEDLGHYVGDYTKAAQMGWGRGQGCASHRDPHHNVIYREVAERRLLVGSRPFCSVPMWRPDRRLRQGERGAGRDQRGVFGRAPVFTPFNSIHNHFHIFHVILGLNYVYILAGAGTTQAPSRWRCSSTASASTRRGRVPSGALRSTGRPAVRRCATRSAW